ncbi:V-ATPase V1 sector subunit E [Madurella fahalii]|uniref:V-ATPase V1 sector subunit E n=1 Tax=Madurella fahalii TaxID=1157608 RepID=A0ABQ0G390_9PEZI
MSQIHSLSDDQVMQELRKMTAFIKQEAMEKAREIEIKANEEFAMEKAKLVRQETDAIDSAYEKKFKQATMSQQITRSTVANKTRLRVLGARQDVLDGIYDAAQKRLSEATKDPQRYEAILKAFVLEGFAIMNEPELQIRARKADYEVVKKAIDAAAAEFKDREGGMEVKATVDEEDPLPEGCAGGVVIIGGNGKIDIDNTLETRLLRLKESSLPLVREALFGKNPNRKFYD